MTTPIEMYTIDSDEVEKIIYEDAKLLAGQVVTEFRRKAYGYYMFIHEDDFEDFVKLSVENGESEIYTREAFDKIRVGHRIYYAGVSY